MSAKFSGPPGFLKVAEAILNRLHAGIGALMDVQMHSAVRASYAVEAALRERVRQVAKWGHQTHPCVPWELPGRGWDERFVAEEMERAAKADCEREFKAGRGTWWHIANEELAEVLAAPPEKRREELVQLTAVCLAWLEDFDNKHPTATEDSSS